MTFIYCKKIITNTIYTSQTQKGEMQQKLDVFLLNDRIGQPEYTELTDQLAAKEIIA